MTEPKTMMLEMLVYIAVVVGAGAATWLYLRGGKT